MFPWATLGKLLLDNVERALHICFRYGLTMNPRLALNSDPSASASECWDHRCSMGLKECEVSTCLRVEASGHLYEDSSGDQLR